MAKEIKRGSAGIQQVGPDLSKKRKPLGAMALVVFLIIDVTKLHLLHHLLGKSSGLVAAALFLGAIVWAILRMGEKGPKPPEVEE